MQELASVSLKEFSEDLLPEVEELVVRLFFVNVIYLCAYLNAGSACKRSCSLHVSLYIRFQGTTVIVSLLWHRSKAV